jgi:hydrogenase maturation protease
MRRLEMVYQNSKLNTQPSKLALVVGYGNALRGDDAVGLHVAEAVARWQMVGLHVAAVHQLTPELAETLSTVRLAIFVDATPYAAPADPATEQPRVAVQPLAPDFHAPSLGHAGDPGQLLALAQVLYGAAPPAYLITVPATSFEIGAPLSPLARRGVRDALDEIRGLIE